MGGGLGSVGENRIADPPRPQHPGAENQYRLQIGQRGHANPELTLRTYAHVMPEEEFDLSFADFSKDRWLQTALSGSERN